MQGAGERDITTAQASAQQVATTREHGLAISVEALAWVGAILVAGVLRLADLDGLPLTVDEAARAFDAARVAGGDVPETWRGDLSAAATSYLFRILGETELVARLAPAAAGAALVAVLWFTRRYSGQIGALAGAALVAFSPLFVIYSRSASEFSVGSLVAAVIVVSLFAYLRDQRPGLLFPLVVALALAPLTDAGAALAALAAVAFLVLEALVFANPDVRQAARSFRSSPLQWVIALFVLSAAFQLGLTHFGTSLERIDLAGVRLLGEMFEQPRDAREPEYHFALLLAYDWPLLLAGGAGFVFAAIKFARGPRTVVTPFDRFLLVWTIVAALALTLATRREGGQLLVLLLPLALLAGRLADEIVAVVDWNAAVRWWPAAAAIIALAVASAILMTEWSSGRADALERCLLIALPIACVALILGTLARSRSGGAVAGGGALALLAAAFLTHTALAAAFSNGAEYAVDARTQSRAEQLADTVDRLAAERNGTIVADADLVDELGWALRDSPVVFGGPLEGAAVVMSRPDAAPPGFAPREEVWRVAEGWYPDELPAPRRMWRWLLDRKPFGDVDVVEVRIYVRTI